MTTRARQWPARSQRRITDCRWAAFVVLIIAAGTLSRAQGPVDIALRFFQAGGAYCFRLAPEGVALSEEREWTVMVLTGTSNRRNTFRIRDVDPGASGFRGSELAAARSAVPGVWRSDRERSEFFDKFAAGIASGVLRARVVRLRPNNLDRLTSDRERAEAYLKFSERGSRVDFVAALDLSPDGLAEYLGYLPD